MLKSPLISVLNDSYYFINYIFRYRNPIEKVAKFLNDKHPRKYRIYNLCSERTYETHHFTGCTVERFMIDDHNVPTLQDMLRFAQSVKEWLNADPENVIVVHCKGIFFIKPIFFLRFNKGQIISE